MTQRPHQLTTRARERRCHAAVWQAMKLSQSTPQTGLRLDAALSEQFRPAKLG